MYSLGFTFGGPLVKDKAFFFIGFNPELADEERTLSYGPGGGTLLFSRNTQTYYTTARIDYALTQKVRIFGSWLYQYLGYNMANSCRVISDSTNGLVNFSTGCFGPNSSAACAGPAIPPSAYSHNQGFSAPNSTTNVGADITLTPHLISTTRFGYYFQNYHDFGFPEGASSFLWEKMTVSAPPIPLARRYPPRCRT